MKVEVIVKRGHKLNQKVFDNVINEEEAKLKWANEYINRDCKVAVCKTFSQAKNYLKGITIKTKVL